MARALQSAVVTVRGHVGIAGTADHVIMKLDNVSVQDPRTRVPVPGVSKHYYFVSLNPLMGSVIRLFRYALAFPYVSPFRSHGRFTIWQ